MYIKIDPRGKIDPNFGYEVLVRRNLMQCIYLFTPQEAKIVGNSRQSSSVVNSLGSFLWRPIKVPLVCGFSPSLCMINSKKPSSYLFAPPGPTNYDKATTFVYSLAPRSLALHEIPTHRHISAKRVFLKFIIPVFLMLIIIYNFSNNTSMPQV